MSTLVVRNFGYEVLYFFNFFNDLVLRYLELGQVLSAQ